MGLGFSCDDHFCLNQALIEAPIGALLVDGTGRCLFANEASREVFGSDEANMLGVGWLAWLEPTDRENVIKVLKAAIENEIRKVPLEFRLGSVPGNYRYCHADLCVIRTPQGTNQGLLYVHGIPLSGNGWQDWMIHASAYREVVARLNSIMTLIEDVVFEIDGNMMFRAVWVADETTLFMPREHFLGKRITEVFGPEHTSMFANPVEEALRTGHKTILEYKHIDPNVDRWFRLKVVPIVTEGNPQDQRLTIAIQEITEEVRRQRILKEAQANLEKSNELLNISEQLSQTGGWEFDLITGNVSWTKQMYVILGVPEDIDFSHFDANLSLFPAADRDVVVRSLEQCKTDRKPYTMELRVTTLQNEKKWVRVRAVPVVENDEVVKLRGALMDITKEKLEAIELLKAKEVAERAAQVKTDFLSVMSHEIRTPLVGIIGSSNQLKRAHLPEQEELVNNLLFSSEHLLRLVNEVLDFNKIESGELKLIQAEINLLELIENIKNQFQDMAQAKEIAMVVEVGPSVPTQVVGDPTRLSQILYNLVSNALKYTDDGMITIAVHEVTRTNTEVELHFSIKDTGLGIPKAYHEEIFKDFQQLVQANHRKNTGFGLGLTITKRLVELHNSRIMLKSEPGEGSEFFFDIRFQLPSAKAMAGGGAEWRPGNYAVNIEGMRVLLVEDNPISTAVIRKQLEDFGLVVDCAENGEEALSFLAGRSYAAALVDLHMPKIDGYVLSEIICREYPDIQIIILTADIMAETRLKLAKLNILEVLNKPFRPTDLHAALLKVRSRP